MLKYRDLWNTLVPLYGEREARAIADYVLQQRFGLHKADVLCSAVEQMGADDSEELQRIMRRLEQAEPVQYVLGKACFAGREFSVSPGVLIPRPETEELCAWIEDDSTHDDSLEILDIGTGSGCIAITLQLDMPQSRVAAWDISADALNVACSNAATLKAGIAIERHDILAEKPHARAWDIIVSNPPYIARKERAAMNRNVLDYEPECALFVPDDNPLLFYKAIAAFAAGSLRPGGRLYMEINPMFADLTADVLRLGGLADVALRSDMYGRQRMVKAVKR